MCTFKKFQLDAAHRATMSISTKNASTKVKGAERAPHLRDGIPARLSNAGGNFSFRHTLGRSGDATQQCDLRWGCAGIVKSLKILGVSADEIGLEGDHQFAGILAVRGKSVSDGILQRCAPNLKGGRETKVGVVSAIIKSREDLIIRPPSENERLAADFRLKGILWNACHLDAIFVGGTRSTTTVTYVPDVNTDHEAITVTVNAIARRMVTGGWKHTANSNRRCESPPQLALVIAV